MKYSLAFALFALALCACTLDAKNLFSTLFCCCCKKPNIVSTPSAPANTPPTPRSEEGSNVPAQMAGYLTVVGVITPSATPQSAIAPYYGSSSSSF